MENKNHLFSRLLPFLFTIISTIIVVFVAQILIEVKSEVKDIKAALNKMEEEKISSVSFQPFQILEENCTDCHSERKYMGIHGGDAEISGIIKSMEKMPDAHLSPERIDKIHSSLTLLKCVHCHGDEQLKQLCAVSPARQRELIEKMSKESKSEILPEDIKQIQQALLKIQGF